jgi:Fe2+ transport system protein FeoA
MKVLSLDSIKTGRAAKVMMIKNDDEKNLKTLKQLANFGVLKGNIVEVVSTQMSGLIILKMENSTFGISKELANNIFVTQI